MAWVPCDTELYETDIPWGLPPAPGIALPLPDASTPDELGATYADAMVTELHVASLVEDVVHYREMLDAALDAISALTVTVTQQQARIHDQSRQIRALMEK
jgi:hypothetical protein